MIAMLAQVVPAADPLISSNAVIGIIGAVTTLVVGVIGKMKIDQARAQANDVTLKRPVPTIETREKPVLVTRSDLDANLTRIDGAIAEAKDAHQKCQAYQSTQRDHIHRRLDDQVKALARMEGTLEGVNQTAKTLLDLALNRKPAARP